jgi:hypothetical protein
MISAETVKLTSSGVEAAQLRGLLWVRRECWVNSRTRTSGGTGGRVPCQGAWGVSPQIQKTRPRAVAEGGVRRGRRVDGLYQRPPRQAADRRATLMHMCTFVGQIAYNTGESRRGELMSIGGR